MRIEGEHDPLPSVTNKTVSQYSSELSRPLRKVFANFAKRKAYEGGRYRIVLGQRFYPTIETLIEDHLMLPPRNAVELLDIFHDELFPNQKMALFFGVVGANC